MPFASRLIFFLIALGIAWYFNYEKLRYMKLLETGQNPHYGEKVKFYRMGVEVMFWVLAIMFIWVLGGEIF